MSARRHPFAGWRHSIEGTCMMVWSMTLDMLEMETVKMFPEPLDRNNRNRQWRECQMAPCLMQLTTCVCAEFGQCPVAVVLRFPHSLALELQTHHQTDTRSD